MKIDYTKKQALFLKADKKLVDELLSLNTNNRNLRKRQLNWLVEAIKKDEFMVTGQPLVVTSEGVLIDGQHRLAAIQKAGYPPVDLMLVTGVNPKAQMYLDLHAKRSLRDVLRLTFDREVNRHLAGTITQLLNYHESKGGVFDLTSQSVSVADAYDFAEKHGKDLSRIIEACGAGVRIAVMAALYIYGKKAGFDEAINFALKIRDGENITKNDPAYKLREYIGRNRHGGSQAAQETFRMTVGACIAQSQGKKVERLRPLSSWSGLVN